MVGWAIADLVGGIGGVYGMGQGRGWRGPGEETARAEEEGAEGWVGSELGFHREPSAWERDVGSCDVSIIQRYSLARDEQSDEISRVILCHPFIHIREDVVRHRSKQTNSTPNSLRHATLSNNRGHSQTPLWPRPITDCFDASHQRQLVPPSHSTSLRT